MKRVWVWVLKFFLYVCFQEKVYQEDNKVQKEKINETQVLFIYYYLVQDTW